MNEFMKWIVSAALVILLLIIIVFGLVFAAVRSTSTFLSEKGRTAVISDTFTAAAYKRGNFYDYYCSHKERVKSDRFCERHNVVCGPECLTAKVDDNARSINATPKTLHSVIKFVGNVDVITDGQVSRDPGILDKYDKVIVLHNEYTTKAEYNAIIHHRKVVYLFPNALFAEVTFNPANSTITLIRGHGYPDKSIQNGFGWDHDNTKEEYNRDCNNWTFHKLENGIQLNCYPEYATKGNTPILNNPSFWKVVRDY
jgi:hypothetical protein